MTAFQTKCIAACQRIFQGQRLELRFHEEQGKIPQLFRGWFLGRTEKFLVGKVMYKSHPIEVFVYADEAGFMVDTKHWFICERPDFQSDEQLIDKLKGMLQKCIIELSQQGD